MSRSFLPTPKGGWASSVRGHLLGARGMTASSLHHLKDAVCTFALVGQWLFVSLTKSADECQNLKIVSKVRGRQK